MGQLFGSSSYTSEEKIMMLYPKMHPLQLIAYEGLWLTTVWIFLLPAFQFIPCSNQDICSGTVIEDTVHAFQDYAEHPI
jgi:hypothetical protein